MEVDVAVVQGGLALACRACHAMARITMEEPTVFDALNDFLDLHRPCPGRGSVAA